MKKKLIVVFLILCMLLSSCGSTEKKQEDDKTVEQQKTEQQTDRQDSQPSPEPTAVEEAKFEGSTITFDTIAEHQTWEGFGAAYTWYGDRLLNAKNAAAGLDRLFSDAKLTILRFKNEYEYVIENKANNALAMAQNYKEARDRAAKYGERVQVLLCCWSPPAKLKSDSTIDTGMGTLARHADGTYMYEEYADWWTESVKYYRSKGIQIDFVSIQNEVDFSPEDYEGCRFDAKENSTHAGYGEALNAVYNAFKAEFGDDAPILIGPETMGCTNGTLMSYIKGIEAVNPEALGGMAYHLYATGTNDSTTMTVKPSSYFTAFSDMDSFYSGYDRKWQTEFYIGQGLQTAELIYHALVTAQMTGYLYWSGVWADSTPGNFESADLIEINNAGEWRTSANYWAMRHYSEFIRPGYIRIDASSDGGPVRVVAFKNENASKIAAVIINSSDKDALYRINGNDYTITESAAYQSKFGEGESEADMYKELGSLGADGVITIPAGSVTTVDITGYYGDTKATVPELKKVTYDSEPVTELEKDEKPTEDVVILDSDFSDDAQVTAYSGFGSSIVRRVADKGTDNTGCMIVKGRADAWNGARLSEGYFEHYGYLVKVSYDVMMLNDTPTVSCTSTFTIDASTYYPDGEKNRIVCTDLKAGEWKHVEGYATMYSNMNEGSFSIYWESPDNTDDIYLDNVKVEILYTQPVGEYQQ